MFHTSGCDNFGPYSIDYGRESIKRWGCIFICLVLRLGLCIYNYAMICQVMPFYVHFFVFKMLREILVRFSSSEPRFSFQGIVC